MNKDKLRIKLIEEKISQDAYSLEDDRTETYCLDSSYGKWSVYYSERGLRTNEKHFESESEACEYLLSELMEDETCHL